MNATAQDFDATLREFVPRRGGGLDLQRKLVGFAAFILNER